MIRIVAVEREYGSGAVAISRAVADHLGWTLQDREITQEIARRLKCDVHTVERVEEKPDPMFHRLSRIFMRGSFESSFEGGRMELLNAETLVQLFDSIIGELANKGNCVIVGRAAPWFLRNRKDVLRVFLFASAEEKVRRTVATGVSEEEAERLVESVDRERAAFVRKYYNHDWPSRPAYHLMINTGMGNAIAVKTILDGIDMLNITQSRESGRDAA